MRGRRVITWRRYQAGDAAAQELPGYEVERPTARPTLESQVLVPLLQAMIIGLVGGLLSTWLLADLLEVVDGWWPSAGLLVLATFGLTFVAKVGAAEATLWVTERTLGVDLDRDGVVGKPEAHIVTVAGPGCSTLTPEERKRAKFVTFVRAVGVTGDGGYTRWERRLGRDRYLEFRDALLKTGLATWRDPDNHRLGWELTRPAEEIIRAVL